MKSSSLLPGMVGERRKETSSVTLISETKDGAGTLRKRQQHHSFPKAQVITYSSLEEYEAMLH
jgi:hypothetical protein